MSNPVTEASKSIGIFSSLENALETTSFLLMSNFLLIVDIGLIYLNGFGIAGLTKNADALKPGIAIQILLLFVFFSLFMSLIVPVVCALILGIYNFIICHLLYAAGRWVDKKIGIENHVEKLERNFVLVNDLREKAHLTKDSYYLSLLKEFDEKNDKYSNHHIKLFILSLSVIISSIFNFFMDLKKTRLVLLTT
jgi:hypothetical protein